MTAKLTRLWPGIVLCIATALGAYGLQFIEHYALGEAYIEALVLAILLGMAIRTFWTPPDRFQEGIQFCAKTLLEVAVMLLGATVSLKAVAAAGVSLLVGVMVIVVTAIGASYGVGRLLRLPPRMALLVACGNSICGNSAIAAVAPVIGADAKDVAASIAFTALLGVATVLGLPFLMPVLHYTDYTYGILAGLTVYAVPQVLAATLPISAVSAQIGTLVKLVRVLMLGPVVLVLSIGRHMLEPQPEGVKKIHLPPLQKLVPWFIVGFLLLATLRSAGGIPDMWQQGITTITVYMTIIAMAALGYGVDIRVMRKVGPSVTAAVTLSLLVLLMLSCGLIHVLGDQLRF